MAGEYKEVLESQEGLSVDYVETGEQYVEPMTVLILVGTALAAATGIYELIIRFRPGLIVDARSTPPTLQKTREVRGDCVLFIDADGEAHGPECESSIITEWLKGLLEKLPDFGKKEQSDEENAQ
jgi:hypothetical protein